MHTEGESGGRRGSPSGSASPTRCRRWAPPRSRRWRRRRPAPGGGSSSTCGGTGRPARALVERARAAGYEALVLTVDTPVAGPRLRDVRNGFTIPPALTLRTMANAAVHPRWWVDLLTTAAAGVRLAALLGRHGRRARRPRLRAGRHPRRRPGAAGDLAGRAGREGRAGRRRRAGGGRRRRRRRRRLQPRRPPARPRARRRWSSCPPSCRRSATGRRCTWTAASWTAPTSSRPSRSAPAPAWSAGPTSTG